MAIVVEHGTIENIDSYMEIYENARKFMSENGNKNQWVDGYPSKDIILNDIKCKNLYVLKNNDEIECIFAFIKGEDPTYLNIYDGKWMDDSTYWVIHRIASTFKNKGTFKKVINWCKTKTNHIRIDTHKDNLPMQKAILSSNFKYCGIIFIDNGDERYAYELLS